MMIELLIFSVYNGSQNTLSPLDWGGGMQQSDYIKNANETVKGLYILYVDVVLVFQLLDFCTMLLCMQEKEIGLYSVISHF
jgi:hypothetical protein